MLQILQTDKNRKWLRVPNGVNSEFYFELQCFILFTQLSFLPCFADGETEAKRLKDLSWATECVDVCSHPLDMCIDY